MKIEQGIRATSLERWVIETYVKMDHTSNLCVPPSNILWAWGIVAVWEVAILLDIDRLFWKLDEMRDEVFLIILCNDLDMSMYTLLCIVYERETEIDKNRLSVIWSMVCSFRLISHVDNDYVIISIRVSIRWRFLPIYYWVPSIYLYTYTMAFANTASKLFSMSSTYTEGLDWYTVPVAIGATLVQSSLYDVPGGYRAVLFDRFSGVQPQASQPPFLVHRDKGLIIGNGRRNTFLGPLAPTGDLVRCQD